MNPKKETPDMFEYVLLAIVAILAIFLIFLYKKSKSLEFRLSELGFRKASQSVKYGKLTEQWIPMSKDFPYNPNDFRFIGSPIDGIVFDDSEIVFCEFKSASAQLNENQKRIKDLVENKKVRWLEFRAD
ncbi:MAG: endonuclease [Candidatus Diapherotrites archaeon]|uniref:Endonuclease n=1 Tax=Candidatus Iainarchaeum sp. TaxID=3101447 RepID=A0A8T4KPZ0_9ARCH|nr:endonuclease [Candidatus Diapherotrites archaeon]